MKKIVLAVPLFVGAVALTGCETYQERPKTVTGAGVGAATGAVIGNVVAGSGKRTQGALIGAAVGALAGGLIGNYMDEQERALRAQTAGTGIEVQRQGDNILLNLPEGVTFDVGRATIKPQFYGALDSVASTLNQYGKTRIEIEGHTDSTGSAEMNQQLSENRAMAVASHLASRGVPRDRMYAIGYGKTQPIADNSTAEGRARNRRVEIIVIPTS
jgi:outer membrane protein OmpA-like peptidoglycan-associated protein